MSTAPTARCWHCTHPVPPHPGRSTVCPHCDRDVRVCLNCRFHNPLDYNGCRETQAERVVDKERANFCDYFSLAEGTGPTQDTGKQHQTDAKKTAEALFKK